MPLQNTILIIKNRRAKLLPWLYFMPPFIAADKAKFALSEDR